MNAFMMLTVGELSDRKNQILVLKALSEIEREHLDIYRNLYYVMVGEGPNSDSYTELIRTHGLDGHVIMPGRRQDIPDILNASDLFVFPSLQEGLPVALMEAMAAGTEVICSDVRGNNDLVKQGLFSPNNVEKLEKRIIAALNGKSSYETLREEFDKKNVIGRMTEIYSQQAGKSRLE